MTTPLRYKFVELSIVTDETLESTVNEWVGRGWQLDGIRFITTEASRRPSMAFVSFVREEEDEDEEGADRKRRASARTREVIELGEIELADEGGDVKLELGEPLDRDPDP